VAFYGIVAEVEKTETCWMYKLISDQITRSHLTVPEARVRPMPISLSDDAMIETRAFTLLERFVAEKQKSAGHMRQTFIHFPRFFSEKQYFPRFSTQYSIESTISRGRFFPALPLLSLGSRFLSCWATFGCCELHKRSRSSHNSITSYWECLRFRSQIHD
jgi:hypothetical protein